MGTDPDTPVIYVADSHDDLSAFSRFLNPEHRRALDKVDFSSDLVLAVFAGAKGSAGHAITVQQVSVVDGQLRVAVRQLVPAPDASAAAAFTSPYHVVKVAKAEFKGIVPSPWMILDDKGKKVASGNRDQQ